MTELELRLEERLAQAKKKRRERSDRIATCSHVEFKRLGEIGSTILDECPACGLVVGVAR